MESRNIDELSVHMSLSESSSQTLLIKAFWRDGKLPATTTAAYLEIFPEDAWKFLADLSQMSFRRLNRGVGQFKYDQGFTLDPAKDFGLHLFNSVFGSSSDITPYYNKVAEAESQGITVRICIEPEGWPLINMPWELMFDPVRNNFLALSPRTPLIRTSVGDAPSWQSEGLQPPKNALIVTSDLSSLCNKEHDEELYSLLSKQFGLQVERLDKPTSEEFHLKLRSRDWAIVHISGTGNFLSPTEPPSDNGMLISPNSYVYAEEMKQETGNPKLVVLSCDNSSRFAWELSKTVPLVIGLQGLISNESMRFFEQTFYQFLLTGSTFENAVVRGRQKIDTENRGARDWGLVVSYSRMPWWRLTAPPETEDSFTLSLQSHSKEGKSSLILPLQSHSREGKADRQWRRYQRELELYSSNLYALNERLKVERLRGLPEEHQKILQQQIIQTTEQIDLLKSEIVSLDSTHVE